MDSRVTKHVNRSEEFVYDVCRKSFLSLWSYANPQRNKGKETRDILVVCDPHVLVISVKEIQLKKTWNSRMVGERWQRKAIDESIKQIKGAIRWLDNATHVVQRDGKIGLPLPPKDRRIYHRIAVAFGSQGEVLIASGEAGVPFVHVFEEGSFYLLFRHLDTISDFIKYLGDKEQLLSQTRLVINGGEENLLAMYLHQGGRFPQDQDLLIIEDDLWSGVSSKPEFVAKLERDRDSYAWDVLIEILCDGGFNGENWLGPGLSDSERSLRVLARENRFGRRLLGSTFKSFLELSKAGTVRSRCVRSLNDVGYVFFTLDARSTFEERRRELLGRCFASLCQLSNCSTIVGIGVNVPGEFSRGDSSVDLVMLDSQEGIWSKDDMEKAVFFRDQLGYFKNPNQTQIHEDEYPVKEIPKESQE